MRRSQSFEDQRGICICKYYVMGKNLAYLRNREEVMCLCEPLLPCLLKGETIQPTYSYY